MVEKIKIDDGIDWPALGLNKLAGDRFYSWDAMFGEWVDYGYRYRPKVRFTDGIVNIVYQ